MTHAISVTFGVVALCFWGVSFVSRHISNHAVQTVIQDGIKKKNPDDILVFVIGVLFDIVFQWIAILFTIAGALIFFLGY